MAETQNNESGTNNYVLETLDDVYEKFEDLEKTQDNQGKRISDLEDKCEILREQLEALKKSDEEEEVE